MPNNQRHLPLSWLVLTLSVVSSAVSADITKDIEDTLKIGKDGAVKIDMRYRFENVNQDDVVNTTTGLPLPKASQPRTANANTIRTRFGILTPTFYGIQGYVEYAGTHVLQSDYNNGKGNKPWFSVIPDPDVNRLNQLWLSYSDIPDTVIKGGRQRINFDDQRFIGSVAWRQQENMYDSVLITNKSVKNLAINAGYIGNIANILGTTDKINAPILNINYAIPDYGNLIGYAYWLGYTEAHNANKSSQTYGIRFINPEKPKKFFDNYSLLYTAEWAIQKDYTNSPVKYETNRFNLMGGFTAYNFSFQGAMEQLNGHGVNQTFTTPLGTNHAFQGWADLFLTTPKDGIRDVFGTVTGKFLENDSLEMTGAYHAFSDDTGKINYGKEWNFQALQKFGKHYSVLAKYAYFDGSGYAFSPNATDTQRVWVQGNISF